MPKKHRTKGRRESAVLHVTTTSERLAAWKSKASSSGMSLKEWVTRSLDGSPELEVRVVPRATDSDVMYTR